MEMNKKNVELISQIGFVCVLVGFYLSYAGIIGVVLCAVAHGESKKLGIKSTLADIGIVLGIIQIVFTIIALIFVGTVFEAFMYGLS